MIKEILTKDKDNDLYKVINISGSSYQGFLVAVYDPSRISIATTKYLGKRGESILTVAKRENAIIAMNAGGFYPRADVFNSLNENISGYRKECEKIWRSIRQLISGQIPMGQ